WQIEQDIKIEPFADSAHRPGLISYGVSSYGYDVRVGRHFKVFTNVHTAIIDPKNFSPSAFIDMEADYCLIPPNSFALAETVAVPALRVLFSILHLENGLLHANPPSLYRRGA